VRRAVAGLFSCLLLQGCISVRHYELGVPLTEADSPDPANGVTATQAMARLGPPLRMSAMPDGYAMAWEYWYIVERSVGFSLRLASVDFLSVDWGRANAEGDFLLMSFDREHRLLTSHLLEWDGDAGGGQGIQPFLSTVDVVDVNDLLQSLPAHDWGIDAFAPLPNSLNRDNRMDTGQNGLERRGTGPGVGQHALESR